MSTSWKTGRTMTFLLAVSVLGPAAAVAQLNLTQYVDPFIGTDDANVADPVGGGAGGSTYPGAVVPFGAVQISPDTPTASPSGYRNADTVIEDISLTHFDGAGCPNHEGLNFMPVIGGLTSSPGNSWNTYQATKSGQAAAPGYWKTTLNRNGAVTIETTATTHTGMARFTYPATTDATVLVSASRSGTGDRSGTLTISGSEVYGQVTVGDFCASGKTYPIYFSMLFDRAPAAYGTFQAGTLSTWSTTVTGTQSGGWVTFNTTGATVVQMKVGISFVSLANARANLSSENGGWSFDAVKTNANNAWNAVLNRVQVSGGTADNLKKFYTALYHVYQSPAVSNDSNGQYVGFDNAIHTAPAGRKIYQNYSGWDIYRSWAALIALTAPEASDIAESMVLDGQQGGALPKWSDQNKECFIMTGDPGPIIVSSLYAFGARNFETASALSIAYNGATNGSTVRGRQGDINNTHYIPGSASDSLEYNASDFAIAWFARALGDTAKYNTLIAHAQYWANVFNPTANFVENRSADGTWPWPLNPANPSGWTEGNAAQYTWMVPHNYSSLMNLMGGKSTAVQRLDHLFTQVNAGQSQPYFYIGNEPEHNQPWAYNFAGAPWGAQSAVRRVMQGAFSSTSGGLPGNDDLGATSAWYVWAALGLYPVTPGADTLALHGPLFTSAAIRMANGALLQINGSGASDSAPYVQSATLNGASLSRTYLTYPEVANGATLNFAMGTTAASWGSGAADAPPSFNDGWIPPAAPPALGVNLAKGKAASGSSPCSTAESPSSAVDGKIAGNSKFCSNAAPIFLQLDLGSAQTVGSFVIKHAGLGGEPTDWNTGAFNIQLSTNATSWTTPVTVSGNTASRTFHPIPAASARYVKLNVSSPVNSGATDTASRIYELEVYGGPVSINSGSTYTIVNQNSGKCVDAASSGTANGTVVQQYTCNSSAAQQWVFTATDSGYFRIATKNGANQVWDVAAAATTDGAKVALSTYASATNQQWKPVAVNGPFYQLVARHSGKCLDVSGASMADVQLQQWACNGSAAQLFSAVLVSVGATPTPTPTATPRSTPTATTRPTPTPTGGTGTIVNLSGTFNVNAAYSDGTTFPSTGGLDGVGSAYSSNLLGTSMTWSSATFNFGAANVLNGARNKTVTLPAGQYTTLLLLGTGVNGDQMSQTVRVNYSDGTSSTFTQTFSNWLNASQNVAGQSIAKSMTYRNKATGVADNRVFNLYGYSFALDNTRVVSSLVLPATNNVSILAATLR